MKIVKPFRPLIWPLVFVALLGLPALACGFLGDSSYEETFDDTGNWGTGSDADVDGQVEGGVFRFLVNASSGFFWSTGGESFGDGAYEVEATQTGGPLDNGYGMLFRVDNDTDSFYVFKVSGDGYTWIGRCADGCAEEEPLVANGWVESAIVKQGLNQTNVLRVLADGPDMTFFVNGQQAGAITDDTLAEGDIAVVVETFGEGGVEVTFDNFKVTPLE